MKTFVPSLSNVSISLSIIAMGKVCIPISLTYTFGLSLVPVLQTELSMETYNHKYLVKWNFKYYEIK